MRNFANQHNVTEVTIAVHADDEFYEKMKKALEYYQPSLSPVVAVRLQTEDNTVFSEFLGIIVVREEVINDDLEAVAEFFQTIIPEMTGNPRYVQGKSKILFCKDNNITAIEMFCNHYGFPSYTFWQDEDETIMYWSTFYINTKRPIRNIMKKRIPTQ
jgi:hypothetical protein